jgi:hypothetical protein
VVKGKPRAAKSDWFCAAWSSGVILISHAGTSPLLTPNCRRHYQSRMTNLTDLTTAQHQRILAIKEQIEALQNQIDSIADGGREGGMPSSVIDKVSKKGRHHMSRMGRANRKNGTMRASMDVTGQNRLIVLHRCKEVVSVGHKVASTVKKDP